MFRIFAKLFGTRKDKSIDINQLLAVLRTPFTIHSNGLRSLHDLLGDDDTYGRMQAFLQQVLWSSVHVQIKGILPESEAASIAKSLNSRFFSTAFVPQGMSIGEVIAAFEFTREKIGTMLIFPTQPNLAYVGTLAALLIYPDFKADGSTGVANLIEILGGSAAIFWQEAQKQTEQLLPAGNDDDDE